MRGTIESPTTTRECCKRKLLLTTLTAIHYIYWIYLKSVRQFYLMESFFKDAPALSWWSYWKRQWSPVSTSPRLLRRKTRVDYTSALLELSQWTTNNCQEYSAFLEQYSSTDTLKLVVPAQLLRDHLDYGLLCGVEWRRNGQLIGIIASRAMGNLNDLPIGLITWFCVHPEWRNRGIARRLLYAIEEYAVPTTIFMFRNDGALKSPLPPLFRQQRVMRYISRCSYPSHRISEEQGRPEFVTYWSYKYPNGFVLSNPNIPASVEYYRMTLNNVRVTLLVQPTYEQQGDKQGCEILAWVNHPTTYPRKDLAYLIEDLIDTLPYDWVEAPLDMPKRNNWKTSQPTSWCLYGYDPGTPTFRELLPLVCA
jgi:GNAT superfamily N-acetyltransferase